jgi:hypothetical protein
VLKTIENVLREVCLANGLADGSGGVVVQKVKRGVSTTKKLNGMGAYLIECKAIKKHLSPQLHGRLHKIRESRNQFSHESGLYCSASKGLEFCLLGFEVLNAVSLEASPVLMLESSTESIEHLRTLELEMELLDASNSVANKKIAEMRQQKIADDAKNKRLADELRRRDLRSLAETESDEQVRKDAEEMKRQAEEEARHEAEEQARKEADEAIRVLQTKKDASKSECSICSKKYGGFKRPRKLCANCCNNVCGSCTEKRKTSKKIEFWRRGEREVKGCAPLPCGNELGARILSATKTHNVCRFCFLEWEIIDKDYSEFGKKRESESVKFLEKKMVRFKGCKKVYTRYREEFDAARIQELDLRLQEMDKRQEERLTGRKLDFIVLISEHVKSESALGIAIETELERAVDGEQKKKDFQEWSESDY